MAIKINDKIYRNLPEQVCANKNDIIDLKRRVKALEEGGSTPIIIDDFLSLESTNPVQNKIITQALNNKQNTIVDVSNEDIDELFN